MREINDQYPEFARAYEPVKGAKHHNGIYGAGSGRKNRPLPVLMLLALLLLLVGVAPAKPPEKPPEEESEEIVAALDDEESEPETEELTEAVTEEPEEESAENVTEVERETETEEASEETTEKPEPTTRREETKTTKTTTGPETTKATTKRTTTTKETKKTSTTKETKKTTTTKETTTTTTTEKKPDTPAAEKKAPQVEVDHLYYWMCISHIELGYEITPNDAEIISSSAKISSNKEPSMSVDTASVNGSGMINANVDATKRLSLLSADEWTSEITVRYRLDGEEKTMTVKDTRYPDTKGFLWADAYGPFTSGDPGDCQVEGKVHFSYPKDDRHTYEIRVTKASIGWMKPVPMDSGGTTYEKVGPTRVLWDGSDASKIEGPWGPEEDDDSMALTYLYSDRADILPDEATKEAGATDCYLIFDIEGTGTDTDGTVYDIDWPTDAQTTPEPIYNDTGKVAPGVEMDHIYYWPHLNHVEMAYRITANDAQNIRSQASTTMEYVDGAKQEFPAQTGAGTFVSNVNCGHNLALFSLGNWITSIPVKYTFTGPDKELEFTYTARPDTFTAYLDAEELAVQGNYEELAANYEVAYVYDKNDRHTYDVEFTKAEIELFKVDSYGNMNSLGTKTIWNGGPDSPFYGPYGPFTYDKDSGKNAIMFSFWDDGIDAAFADDAEYFRLYFYAEGSGTDTDGTVYPFTEEMYSTEYTEIPD